ncbi:MAG: hypothetical protein MUP86_02295 [Dehalococcoidia bacterium]|nr:hypothetical protein [Dehalococcoidia bacterium]
MITCPKDVVVADVSGRTWNGYYRRAGPTMPANAWGDLSYAAGIPSSNYYASSPMVSAALSAADGIDQGPAAALTKTLRRWTIIPPTACGISDFRLQDSCIYYPFIDGDGGYQAMTQAAIITRYDGGHGCFVMAVSQGVGTAQADVTLTYTNSDGLDGRTVTATLNFAAAAGQLTSSCPAGSAYTGACGPYFPLMVGCRGVRSIQSAEVLTAAGGICALVIVRPIADLGMIEATTSVLETDFYDDMQQIPEIGPGAYLNLIMHTITAAAPATVIGRCDFIWKE